MRGGSSVYKWTQGNQALSQPTRQASNNHAPGQEEVSHRQCGAALAGVEEESVHRAAQWRVEGGGDLHLSQRGGGRVRWGGEAHAGAV